MSPLIVCMAHTYSSNNTWETEAEGSEAQGHLELHETLYLPPSFFFFAHHMQLKRRCPFKTVSKDKK